MYVCMMHVRIKSVSVRARARARARARVRANRCARERIRNDGVSEADWEP